MLVGSILDAAKQARKSVRELDELYTTGFRGAEVELVSALIEDLFQRGLDQKVLFVFCGEFGRTPLIRNQDSSGRPGRDRATLVG